MPRCAAVALPGPAAGSKGWRAKTNAQKKRAAASGWTEHDARVGIAAAPAQVHERLAVACEEGLELHLEREVDDRAELPLGDLLREEPVRELLLADLVQHAVRPRLDLGGGGLGAVLPGGDALAEGAEQVGREERAVDGVVDVAPQLAREAHVAHEDGPEEEVDVRRDRLRLDDRHEVRRDLLDRGADEALEEAVRRALEGERRALARDLREGARGAPSARATPSEREEVVRVSLSRASRG